ncbi:MAG: hypothetical protein AB7E21_07800, partial [Pseudodonghicola sp.]
TATWGDCPAAAFGDRRRSPSDLGRPATALKASLERSGIERGARCGSAIGLSDPPDWGERLISLRAEDQTVLQPAAADVRDEVRKRIGPAGSPGLLYLYASTGADQLRTSFS